MCGELCTFAVQFLSLWRESINERVKTHTMVGDDDAKYFALALGFS